MAPDQCIPESDHRRRLERINAEPIRSKAAAEQKFTQWSRYGCVATGLRDWLRHQSESPAACRRHGQLHLLDPAKQVAQSTKNTRAVVGKHRSLLRQLPWNSILDGARDAAGQRSRIVLLTMAAAGSDRHSGHHRCSRRSPCRDRP